MRRFARTWSHSILTLTMKLLDAVPVLVAFLCISDAFGLKTSMQLPSVGFIPNTSLTLRGSLMLNVRMFGTAFLRAVASDLSNLWMYHEYTSDHGYDSHPQSHPGY